ncbi:Nectin-3-like protein [Bagarius yarrelli]|uniref:Nectin-3-like protein n=1 Tax=Bagarius yarrelli TaxID=175774 RepID=A0A556U019_BAGYA|nr:Nectin-3-like protein [Bagarius yarrelli]
MRVTLIGVHSQLCMNHQPTNSVVGTEGVNGGTWSPSLSIKVIGQDVNVTAGDDAQLFCQVVDTSEPLTSITWQRRTKKKPTNAEFFITTSDGDEHINGLKDRLKFTGDISGPNGTIVLSNVTVLDEGIYTCIFSVFPSGPFETEVRLKVQVPPVVSVGTDVPAVAGDTEKIIATCTAADATPAAEVSWSLGVLTDSVKVKTNVTVDSEERYTVQSNLIANATKTLNQKKVLCLVKHPGLKEKLELNYTLNIYYPPQLVYIILAVDHEETGKFQCEADANPKPTTFTWSRRFPVQEPLSTGINSTLNNQLTPDSNGFYYCVVSNQHGDAVGSLNVQVKPYESMIEWFNPLYWDHTLAWWRGLFLLKYPLRDFQRKPNDPIDFIT